MNVLLDITDYVHLYVVQSLTGTPQCKVHIIILLVKVLENSEGVLGFNLEDCKHRRMTTAAP